jgi:hypothetical protein
MELALELGIYIHLLLYLCLGRERKQQAGLRCSLLSCSGSEAPRSVSAAQGSTFDDSLEARREQPHASRSAHNFQIKILV